MAQLNLLALIGYYFNDHNQTLIFNALVSEAQIIILIGRVCAFAGEVCIIISCMFSCGMIALGGSK